LVKVTIIWGIRGEFFWKNGVIVIFKNTETLSVREEIKSIITNRLSPSQSFIKADNIVFCECGTSTSEVGY
jgi:hypothetical protein